MNADFYAAQALTSEVTDVADDGDNNSRLDTATTIASTTTTSAAKRRRQQVVLPPASTATATTAIEASEATVIHQSKQKKQHQQASQIYHHHQQQQQQQQRQQLTLYQRDLESSANQLTDKHPEAATIVNSGDGAGVGSATPSGCAACPVNQIQQPKPRNICYHQEILATPQAPESNQEKEQHSNGSKSFNPRVLAQSSSARCSEHNCAPASLSPGQIIFAGQTNQAAIERQHQFDNYNSNNISFWKFLLNLPKSITQGGKSTTLEPEVAGYLASRELQQQSGQQCNYSQNVMPRSPQATSLDELPKSKSSILKQHQEQQHQCQMMTTALATTMKAPAGPPFGCTQPPQDGQRLIKIMAPPAALVASHQDVSAHQQQQLLQLQTGVINEHHQNMASDSITKLSNQTASATGQQHQQIKLSIATTTTTTRSSASSLSSCILSDSSTSEVRLKWGKKMDFLLSIIGFAVDLANIWRFPYLVYKNGGGVFLIPYVTMLIFGGIPLFFLELCLGQFVKKGPITVWNKICPSMKGVGYCSILISWYVSFYYNVLIAWSVYFIYRSFSSFGDKMPWEDCDNSWNSEGTCVSISQLKNLCSTRNESLEACRKELFASVNVTSPASEFFVKELSQIDQSTGLDDMGYLRPELVLCTMVVYLLHFFSLFRGLETSGKVVWVTATAPYMILSILLVRGLFLPGASMGIEYYLSPKLEKLADPQVWIDAAGQVFYSIGVGFGVHLTFASFNNHNNNCYRDCLMTSAVNAATSVYSGLVVFVYLGYMAKNLGIEIDKVASEGYSLVFEVYPEALTTLPFARFWSILFFIMLLTLGIDSAMGGLEAVITGLEDEFKFAKRLSRGQLTALVIVSSFVPALVSCTQGGAYTLFWFDIYSAGVSLLFSALFETIGVVYCYGLDKFIPNIESMLGRKPHMFYIVCWKYISPIFLGGVIFMSIYTAITAPAPTYRGYVFPLWSIILGWCLAFSSVAAVPIVAIWHRYLRTPEKSPRRRDRSGTGSSAAGSKTVSVSCGSGSQTQRGQTTRTTVLTTTSHSML